MHEYHLNLNEIQELPIYLACLLLGAIGPDHVGVRMTFADTMRYYAGDPEKMKLLTALAGTRQQDCKRS